MTEEEVMKLNIRDRFGAMLALDKTAPGDVERYALFYVVARTNTLMRRFLSGKLYDVDSHCLIVNPKSLGSDYDDILLRRACHMYNPKHQDVTTRELDNLDNYNTQTIIGALMIFNNIENINIW